MLVWRDSGSPRQMDGGGG
ncbi:hypothetical protein LINPERHAP1_LOCUS15168 [Linum perenne]